MQRKNRRRKAILVLAVVFLSMAAAFAVLAEENSEYVTIKIHYRLEDEKGEQIFDDYVASLQYGTNFSAEVPSPTFIGYAPCQKKEGNYVSADRVSLSFENLQENQELIVVYRPVMSPYVVRYYLQNMSNDGYTEDTRLMEKGEALTGTYPVNSVEKDIEGFSALFHKPDVVAADGSTEFHIYYNRNYYLYNFECNGGYGVAPVYARYETPLIVPKPTRSGYVFAGWDKEKDGSYDGIADTLPAAVGAQNETFRAIWTPVETTVTYVYWKENPDDDGYSFWDTKSENAVSGDPITMSDIERKKEPPNITQFEESHYSYDEDKTKTELERTSSVVEGDGSTVINIYYQRKEYTLKFFYAKETNNKYYVVGGSTYAFSTTNTTNEQTLLQSVPSGNWGEIENLPEMNAQGSSFWTAEKKAQYHFEQGYETYGGVKYHYFQFRAKYGANIQEPWPFGIFSTVERTSANTHGNWNKKTAVFSAWNPEHHVKYCVDELATGDANYTIKGNYLRLEEDILYDSKYGNSDTIRYIAFWENGANIGWSVPKQWIYNLYYEVSRGQEQADDVIRNGKRYRLFASYDTCDDNENLNKQTATVGKGYTLSDKEKITNSTIPEEYQKSFTANFYYDRSDYLLRFYNYDGYLFQAGKQVEYERSLTEYLEYLKQSQPADAEKISNPPYPESLERNAYRFDGWYTSPGCYEGTEALWENGQSGIFMDAAPLTLYAKWTPTLCRVTFSNTYDEMMAGKYIGDREISVAHRGKINTQDIPTPSSDSISTEMNPEFRGWFYVDSEGNQHAFDPTTMSITEDLHLFAQWQSSVVGSYTVHYVDEAGNPVSEDTDGYAYVGTTKTFEAKSREDLYEQYQDGYYPTINSASLLIYSSKKNEITFVYVKRDHVSYTVRYLDQTTGEDVHPQKSRTTSASVITEQFQYVSGYISDAFYKRMVLTAYDEQNVITFYYTKDDRNAYYAVKHMVEESDGTGYAEYASIEQVGEMGKSVSAELLDVDGFTYDREKTAEMNQSGTVVTDSSVSAVLGGSGLVLYVYYTRNQGECEIRFVEYGHADNELKESVTLRGKFGRSEEYKDIPLEISKGGTLYHLVGDNTTRTVTFPNGQQKSYVYVYYQVKESTLTYIPVFHYPGSGGTVSLSNETVRDVGSVQGSVPHPAAGCQFAGWFHDIACTKPVPKEWTDEADGRLKPGNLSENTQENIYYALFEPEVADLVIEKQGVDTKDQNQSFLFYVDGKKGTVTENVHLTVSVTGNGSVTVKNLPVGTYMVAEQEEWSWRYTPEEGEKDVSVSKDTENAVTFKNTKKMKAWLGGEAHAENNFQGIYEP